MSRLARRLLVLGALLLLPLTLGGCFLNVFQTGETLPPGHFSWLLGLGGQFIASPSQWASQLHLRCGIAPDTDLGVSSGLLITPQSGQITPLGLVADLRRRLHHRPAFTLGLGLGSLSFSSLLSDISLYLSQPFGVLTPYAAYRASLTLSAAAGPEIIQQLAAGVAIENRNRTPIFLEISWREGQILLGFAARF